MQSELFIAKEVTPCPSETNNVYVTALKEFCTDECGGNRTFVTREKLLRNADSFVASARSTYTVLSRFSARPNEWEWGYR